MKTQNKTITEDYCDFETAKLLKEKGFDEPIEMLIRKDGTRYHADTNSVCKKRHIILRNSEINMYSTDLSCPSIQMAMKWLRERKIYIMIDRSISMTDSWLYCICIDNDFDNLIKQGSIPNRTYEEAVEDALKYCLKNLI